MRTIWSLIAPILIFGYALFTSIDIAKACSAPVISPHATVGGADVIVRAIPIELVANEGVRFKVAEVLKGEDVPPALIIKGSLSMRDEFNGRPVPYWHVRSSGSGPCYAYEYKEGAEFLLLLKKQKSKLTPYWYPLAPTNEQLQSAADPWLVWVKGHLKWLKNATEIEKLQLNFELMKKTGWDIDAPLLWRYRFIDPDEAKLQRLAKYLESIGYRYFEISKSDKEDELGDYVLYVEKVEKHSPTTIAQRNQEFRALTATFGVRSYKEWVVSRVK